MLLVTQLKDYLSGYLLSLSIVFHRILNLSCLNKLKITTADLSLWTHVHNSDFSTNGVLYSVNHLTFYTLGSQ